MKKVFIILLFVLPFRSDAQVIEIIKAVITAAIKAVDLKIQQLQNETIWLQNAQKQAENAMSEAKLGDITVSVQKQKDLFEGYYKELTQVKTAIAGYKVVTGIIQKQLQLVQEYKRYGALFKSDGHFTADELVHMDKVYTGIINESVKNLDQVIKVISSFSSSMKDEERMAIIHAASARMEENYSDLVAFNNQAIQLSLQRAKDKNDINTIKKLYGLP